MASIIAHHFVILCDNPGAVITTSQSSPLRTLALLPVWAVFIGAFFPTFQSLHTRWSAWDESYSHGYLLLFVAFYLYFDTHRCAPSWLPDIRKFALFILALASLSWALFYVAGINLLQQLMLPIIISALLGVLLDRDRFWRALLPVNLLFLAIPLWDELVVGTLQAAAAKVSAWVVAHAFGIPTAIDGFYISIPAGTFEIASGCAGLVFLLSATTLGVVYGELFLQRTRTRLLAIIVAIALGIIMNWVRIIALIVIGQYSNMHHSLITEGHLLFGWYLFSGLLFVILIATYIFIKPIHRSTRLPLPAQNYSARQISVALCALISGPLLLWVARFALAQPVPISTPAKLGPDLIQTTPRLTGFKGSTFNATYRHALEPRITVSVVFYANTFGYGRLTNQSNKVLPDNARIQAEQLAEGADTIPAHRIVRARINAEQILIWDWYKVGEREAATLNAAKTAQLRETSKGHLQGMYIQLQIRCKTSNCSNDQQLLAKHARDIHQAIQPLLSELTHLP